MREDDEQAAASKAMWTFAPPPASPGPDDVRQDFDWIRIPNGDIWGYVGGCQCPCGVRHSAMNEMIQCKRCGRWIARDGNYYATYKG